jgi:hypothetical protein
MARASLYKVLSEATADLLKHGYDNEQRLTYWIARIKAAIASSLVPESVVEASVRRVLGKVYDQQVTKGAIFKKNPGVERFTIEQLKPAMRQELDKRILAGVNLIKLNRKRSVDTTLQRFSGWATSIPAGGTKAQSKSEETTKLRKSFRSLPFEDRRVAIDQGHKLASAINEIVATGNNAIAVEWHSHWRQPGYNYRKDHKERDEQIYLIRPSWALEKGLVKVGKAGYYDEITKPAEEVFCRCYAVFIYNLTEMPLDMLTKKGRTYV